jgi:hypothetical protein
MLGKKLPFLSSWDGGCDVADFGGGEPGPVSVALVCVGLSPVIEPGAYGQGGPRLDQFLGDDTYCFADEV